MGNLERPASKLLRDADSLSRQPCLTPVESSHPRTCTLPDLLEESPRMEGQKELFPCFIHLELIVVY